MRREGRSPHPYPMASATPFRRASNLLHASVGSSSRNALVTSVDVELMARTIAFVTSIARVPIDTLAGIIETEPATYTVDSATRLADQVRQRLQIGDVEPLLDLPSRLPAQLATLVFPIDTGALSSASVIFEGVRFLFVSSRLGSDQVPECARALATALALSNRSRGTERTNNETNPPALRGVGPRAMT